MNDKLLMETAVLAGEIMLVSGAEIYRVEDTISRILKNSGRQVVEVIVLSTGIFATLNDPSTEAITVTKRVSKRCTNLNRVYLVNDVSRKLCNGQLKLEDAYAQLRQIEQVLQYRPWLKKLGYVCVSLFFCILLGGQLWDVTAAALVGLVLACSLPVLSHLKLNDFCQNAAASFLIAISALILGSVRPGTVNIDLVIISSIMPLVPGVIFTTAIRDTLNGDYGSGIARILEAVVVALAVAAGVGAGMLVVSYLTGGVTTW